VEVTVSQLATVVGIPIDRLLKQLADAGIQKSDGADVVTEHDKIVLLTHLRSIHGKNISLKKIESSAEPKTVTVEIRRKTPPKEKKKQSKDTESQLKAPKVFISYSYDSPEHIKWVEQLSTMLRTDGVDAILDTWHIHPGDPITEFMESGLRESDFVLIVCTENYKYKSDKRVGGVGYEESIISGDMFTSANHRKYIPVLASNNSSAAIPTALHSKRYIDLSRDDAFGDSYRDLLITLFGRRPEAPPLGKAPSYVFT
jgi:hypothetical protein